MRLEIKEDSKEFWMLNRLQKVFDTKNPTDTFRMALEKAYNIIRQQEIEKAATRQAEHPYDESMTALQGHEDE